MFFKELEIYNFRNYKNIKFDFHEKVNIITGNNAQGKTNLLESLYVMCLGKSFRTNKDSEMIRFGEERAVVKSCFIKDDRDRQIEISFEKNNKSIKVDEQKVSKKSDILSHMHIVIFSPEDLKIIKDEPEKRRRFIDRELCQIKPMYYKNLSRYKKILLQRNNILKNDTINMDVLSAWDTELIEYGSKIIIERERFIKKINKISKDIHSNITSGKENLEVFYESSIDFKENISLQKHEFEKILDENKKNDAVRRTTTRGPHKDDIKICINEIDIRHFGSQGQQRTAALSLKLAEIKLIEEETGDKPVLLLDDVLSELDFERQKFLINSLHDVQLFLTTTEISEYVKKSLYNNKTFTISNGISIE